MWATSLLQHERHLPHLLSCCGAGHLRAPAGALVVNTPLVVGHLLVAGPSTIVALTRIVKLSGTIPPLATYACTIPSSRVGNQCLILGVNAATAQIFVKCSVDCRSPLSCHLCHFVALCCSNVTIATVQLAPAIDAKRRACAVFTLE